MGFVDKPSHQPAVAQDTEDGLPMNFGEEQFTGAGACEVAVSAAEVLAAGGDSKDANMFGLFGRENIVSNQFFDVGVGDVQHDGHHPEARVPGAEDLVLDGLCCGTEAKGVYTG